MNRRKFFGSMLGLGAFATTGPLKASDKLEDIVDIVDNDDGPKTLVFRNDGGISLRAQDTFIDVVPQVKEKEICSPGGNMCIGPSSPKTTLHIGIGEKGDKINWNT